MTVTVTHDPASDRFIHDTGRQWRQSYPVARLAERLAFYRRLRDEHPKAGNNYDADIVALERLSEELGIEIPPR